MAPLPLAEGGAGAGVGSRRSLVGIPSPLIGWRRQGEEEDGELRVLE